jgi:hypothetical protein
MTVEEARKLVDLFLDDELPMELASEFKQVMFENVDLRDEVSSLRQNKEALATSFEGDSMTEDERLRVFSRIIADSAALRGPEPLVPNPRQLSLPLSGARR